MILVSARFYVIDKMLESYCVSSSMIHRLFMIGGIFERGEYVFE